MRAKKIRATGKKPLKHCWFEILFPFQPIWARLFPINSGSFPYSFILTILLDKLSDKKLRKMTNGHPSAVDSCGDGAPALSVWNGLRFSLGFSRLVVDL